LKKEVRYKPRVQKLIALDKVDQKLEVRHIVIFLRRPIVIVDDYLGIKYFPGQKSHQLRDKHF